MRLYFLILVTLTSFGANAKLNCDEPFVDIKSDFLVKEIRSIDEDSQEPTLRQVIAYDSGDLTVVHQKTCAMSNIQIEYFYNNTNNSAVVSNFLDIFNQIKSKYHLEVNENFNHGLLDILKSSSLTSKNITIASPTDSVEYDFSIQVEDSYFGLYTKKLSFYISIGGL
ncbi:hypothetical protein F0237_05080 [Vibrio tubiashii]|uniref:Uncharacterized protein n=1 Tax=Vibrio tubiashii TaxID=29498 RepID=A0AAE5GNB6_9VIBR|nr:hypothetical protein [Vibrio tubiashii]NOI80033.1 hypothetical protein [Vibrio tubiashii]